MAWDDILFGFLTGGLYNIGKKVGEAAGEAGDALEEVGEAAEQAGIALAILGSTIESVGKQLDSLLEETEELITINRLTPRDESDLWEEEKERLDDLRAKKTELENKLAELGVTQPGSFSFDIWEFMTDPQSVLEKLRLISALVQVNNEIHEILYQEPGVITTAIYNASESLERFNTIEQPMLEDILDSVDDAVEVTEETIQEIKKLFVTKRKVAVPEIELTPALKDKLKVLELDHKFYQDMLRKKGVIAGQLLGAIEKIPATKFDITEKGIKVEGKTASILDDIRFEPKINISKDLEKTGNPVRKTEPGNVRTTIASDNRKPEYRASMPVKESKVAGRDIESLARVNLALARKPSLSLSKIQPQGAMISAVMNTKLDGYQRKYASSRAHMAFYDRQIWKTGKKIDRIRYRWEEEPGVIPRTLDEVEQILKRFRTEEQPRVDTVLDTLNANLEESKETLSKVNDSLDATRGLFSFIEQHGSLIKLGLGVFGAVVFLDFLFLFIVLLRTALGI